MNVYSFKKRMPVQIRFYYNILEDTIKLPAPAMMFTGHIVRCRTILPLQTPKLKLIPQILK